MPSRTRRARRVRAVVAALAVAVSLASPSPLLRRSDAQTVGDFGSAPLGAPTPTRVLGQGPSARHISRFTLETVAEEGKALPLTAGWKFRLGDHPVWMSATLDDRVWEGLSPDVAPPEGLVEQVAELERQGQPAIGWLRLHLSADPTLVGQPLALGLVTHGAAEVYVDGTRVLTAGELAEPGARAAIGSPLLPVPVVFRSTSPVIAVRYHFGSAADVASRLPHRDLFHLTLAPASAIEAQAREARYYAGLMLGLFGLFAALGLGHLILFLLLRHPTGNLFYAGFAILFALYPLLTHLASASGELRTAMLVQKLASVAAGVSLLALLAFLYSTFFDRIPRIFWGLAVLTLGWVTLTFLPANELSGAGIWLMVAVFAIEGTRVLAVALARNRDGARIIGAGFMVTFGILIYLALGYFGLAPESGDLFWYGWIGIALSSSSYLAHSFARTSKGFEALSGHLEEEVRKRTAQLQEATLAAEQANQTKSQFLANMSHELRTPLNAILGYSEMLMEEAEELGDEAYVPDLQKINASGKHLLGLINDILDLSKIEAGKMELYLERFEVAPLVDEVAATIRPLIEKNENELVLRGGEAAGSMRADQVKVRQALLNLLSNASKFTERGRITLEVERSGADDGDEWVVFRITDTGIGMTPEQIGKLFRPFTQADASTTKKYGGTGLGLTITRHFVEMMGGAITVQSTLGVGTTFTIRLPATVADLPRPMALSPEAAAALSGAAMPRDSEEARGTILVIDDDVETREVVQRMLTREGFRVVGATSGPEGLELARREKPDVITLDVLLPGMDGWTVLGVLKGDEQLRHVPVVMMTIVEDKNLGFALGAADYLTKPVDRERLVETLQRHFPASGSARVLVVDDDPATRALLHRMLAREGWVVDEAENGRAALETLARHRPDVILLDLMMPEMDGFEFVDAIRHDQSTRPLPVVVITSKDLHEEDRARLRGGVERILQKGNHPREELIAEIKLLLKKVGGAEAIGA